jgi:phosphatidylinositol glycan class C protein
MFACCCLLCSTSCLGSLLQFAYVLFCLELFLLLPYMRRYIRQTSAAAHLALTAAMVAAAGGLLAPLSRALLAAYAAGVVFVSLVCPAWLVSIHKFKNKINGPWDEAVPAMPTALHQQWLERRGQGAAGGQGRQE